MDRIADRVRRLNAAVNAHDLNPIGDMYAEDGEFIWPGLPPLKGRQAVLAWYAQMLGAFPDIQVRIDRIVEQGDTVAVEYETRATNSGPLRCRALTFCRRRTRGSSSGPFRSGGPTRADASRRSTNISISSRS